jgi:NADH-quinone oxidoreductase subunit J
VHQSNRENGGHVDRLDRSALTTKVEFKVIVFWVLAVIMIGAALRVITAKNTVHAALYLVLTFFNAAGIWMLLQAEFLAIALVLVYVGAVMVLFLFVLMMLDIDFEQMRANFWKHLPLVIGIGLLTVIQMTMVLWSKVRDAGSGAVPASVAAPPPGYSNSKQLGISIYTQYIYAVEIAAVILLVAIVAAIALTLRKRKQTKYQDPSKQIRIRREDRVRVLPMEPVARERPGTLKESIEGTTRGTPVGKSGL